MSVESNVYNLIDVFPTDTTFSTTSRPEVEGSQGLSGRKWCIKTEITVFLHQEFLY